MRFLKASFQSRRQKFCLFKISALNAFIMRFWLILIYVYTILTTIASTSTRKHHSHTQTIMRASSEVGSMSDDEGQHRRRTKWTDKMCIDLQLCKRKALDLHNSDDCPKKPNGRKVGVMNITLRFWND